MFSDLHLFLLSCPPPPLHSTRRPVPKELWKYDGKSPGERKDVVNTITFLPTSLLDDTGRVGTELRMVVAGNNRAVRVYDLNLHSTPRGNQRMELCGELEMETCVNHGAYFASAIQVVSSNIAPL